jgi:ATP-dependent DNA helicase DinG
MFSQMNALRTDTAALFSQDGPLAGRDGFEYRPQQSAMAIAVAEALASRTHLIVEAPTGVGKTLAYLIPALLHVIEEGRKAIVSTHTKNLQEQLLQKDIPIARTLLRTPFHVATLKGRRNYLCTTRLTNALGARHGLLDPEGQVELEAIRAWSTTTVDGDLEGLGFTPRADVWEMVCSETGVCSSATCSSQCFFQRAKVRAREAHLLIVNHALFFSLWRMNEGSEFFLFPDDFVIFDEAHTLEGVAAAGTGLHVSRRKAIQAVHKLYHPRTKKGLLAGKRKHIGLCDRALVGIDSFFDTVELAARGMSSGQRSTDVRIRTRGLVVNTLTGAIEPLLGHVQSREEDVDDLFRRQELVTARAALVDVLTSADCFLEQTEASWTYWVELGPSKQVALCASPSDVGEFLRERLFRERASVIMTSATLSVEGSLDYFRARIGARDASEKILDSPFDHQRQTTLAIARDITEPDRDGYAEELPGWIMSAVERSHGRALVLFTNAVLMRRVAEVLATQFEAGGIRLLVQGIDGQRHALLRTFQEDIDSVLFGLDSFWSGVDVPGKALEHVIITRLPFALPSHPLTEARLETIAARGGNAFFEHTLPEAILRFKQGAGRLIRSHDDRGIITVLDSRLLRRSYGRKFILSLPPCPVELFQLDGTTEIIEREIE